MCEIIFRLKLFVTHSLLDTDKQIHKWHFANQLTPGSQPTKATLARPA